MTTKIIATIGPISDTPRMIAQMADAGMTILRCNFSHCTEAEYKARYKIVKEYNKKNNKHLQILADLRGPRLRIGNIPDEGITVRKGEVITFVTNPGKNKTESEIPVDDEYLHADVKKGDIILIGNGVIELVVEKTMAATHRIVAKVVIPGTIYPRKGLNLPTTRLTTPAFTDKDRQDLKFILKTGADIVALSFVQDAADILRVRKIIGRRPIKIVAKIERREALNNIDEIIDAADGIMVARGDLGVEIPDEEVPIVQKQIIRKCHIKMKPVIVATQMLSSMTANPFPTRAEVSDVANAVFDGAHIIMLSDETAGGQFPLESVKAMKRIAKKAEEFLQY